VDPLEVAVVSRDPALRVAAAAAFDSAPSAWTVSLHESGPESADVVVVCPDMPAPPRECRWVRFDPARPLSLVGAVAEVSRPLSSVIGVTGAGRGTGPTKGGQPRGEVCFLDLDVTWGAACRLGLEASEVRTWADAGTSEEDLVLSALPVAGGFRALLAPPCASEDGAGQLVARARRRWARLIVDCPAPSMLGHVAELCRGGVLVVPPTRPGATRARSILERWPDLQWAVVLNKLGPGGEMTRAELQDVLGRGVALELPCSPGLRDSEDDGRLLTSRWSRWWRGTTKLARALERL
jgi:hypothetical protein